MTTPLVTPERRARNRTAIWRFRMWAAKHLLGIGWTLIPNDHPGKLDLDKAIVVFCITPDQRRDTLVAAVKEDIENAKAVCGGDGKGCETFRGYYDNDEIRYRKCGQCPMDALSATRGAMKDIE